MRSLKSESGVARWALIPAILAAIVAVGLIAGNALLSRYASPDRVAGALEGALGMPVSVGEVKIRPIALTAVVEDVALGPLTTVRSASVRFDPSSIISRRWKIEAVALSGPVWTLPGSVDEVEPFAKGLLLPLWLAGRAGRVTIEDGTLVGREGETRLCSELHGSLSSAFEETGSRRVEMNLKGVLPGYGEASASGYYSAYAGGDSAVATNLMLSCAGRDISGSARLSWGSPSRIRAELLAPGFYGGTATASLDLGVSSRGEGPGARIELRGCDGAGLLRDGLGLDVLSSGSLSADADLHGDLAEIMGARLGGVEALCTLEVTDAVLSPDGTLAELLPLAAGAGGGKVGSATARLAISQSEIVVKEMTLESEGVTWKIKGRVMRDRSLSGVVVGRVPAEMIGGEGTAISLVKAMLADSRGRIPAAFTMGGSLDHPRVYFDVERTADEAAAAGRPQARQLLKAMSRSDIERLNRNVDALLGGMRVN